MRQELPKKTVSGILSRFDEMIDHLIETSDMIDRGDDDFDSWCWLMQHACARLHIDETNKKEPRHPKGLIKTLKTQRKKVELVRRNLAKLPEQFAITMFSSSYNINLLPENEGLLTRKFTSFSLGTFDHLAFSSVSIGLNIAKAVRESPNDRRNSPKTRFARELIYLFQWANLANKVTSSIQGDFADFFSSAYYIATGIEGEFLERPIKTAIAELKLEFGIVLHPDIYARKSSEKIEEELKEYWPELVTKIMKSNSKSSFKEEQEFSDYFHRKQVADAEWFLENLDISFGLDLVILNELLESGLRALKQPTKSERKRLSGLLEQRTRTHADVDDPMY